MWAKESKGSKRSKEDWFHELQHLSQGAWLKESLLLHKFLSEKVGVERKKKKLMVGGDVEVAVKKEKRKITGWQEWNLANFRIVNLACPNEEMQREYRGYMERGLLLQDQGVPWKAFWRMDTAYRELRQEQAARWSTTFPHLFTLLVPSLEDVQREGGGRKESSGGRASGDHRKGEGRRKYCYLYNTEGGCHFGE